jgi:UDP-GlcNAc3NAcA epimerase
LLFCPTQTSINNLKKEGFNIQQQKADCNLPAVYHCGDIMYDNSLYFSQKAQTKSNIIQQLELTSGRFVLVTIHRDYNTDNPQRLTSIFQALLTIANQFSTPIILPIHPRTKKILPSSLPPELYDNILNNYFIKMIPPAGYLDMIALETNSSIIITDSGGVQKEAYFFKKPCLIIRSETEWVELLETNSAILCDADTQLIIQGYQKFIESPPTYFPPIFGSGQTAQFIIEKLLEHADISSGHN